MSSVLDSHFHPAISLFKEVHLSIGILAFLTNHQTFRTAVFFLRTEWLSCTTYDSRYPIGEFARTMTPAKLEEGILSVGGGGGEDGSDGETGSSEP